MCRNKGKYTVIIAAVCAILTLLFFMAIYVLNLNASDNALVDSSINKFALIVIVALCVTLLAAHIGGKAVFKSELNFLGLPLKNPRIFVTGGICVFIVVVVVCTWSIGQLQGEQVSVGNKAGTTSKKDIGGWIMVDGIATKGIQVGIMGINNIYKTNAMGGFSCEVPNTLSDTLSLTIGIPDCTPVQRQFVNGDTVRLFSSFLNPESPFGLSIDNLPEKNLEALLGQLFFIGYADDSNPTYDNSVVGQLITKYHIGGLIFFSYNIPYYHDTSESVSSAQKIEGLMNLTYELQRQAKDHIGIPLFISMDQEGGICLTLLKGTGVEFPSPMAIGALRDENVAYDIGHMIGSELNILGINMNFAPVADINTNKRNDLIRDRSFGGHQNLVAPLARAFFEGQRDAGIFSVAKHFPGHGHTLGGLATPGIPESSHTIKSLINSIVPFRELALDGIEGIMTSHFLCQVEFKTPVTFNKCLVHDILRQSGSYPLADGTIECLGYDGLIITDDLCVPAITADDKSDNGNIYASRVAKATLRAFDAGHDILMIAHVRANDTPDRGLCDKGVKFRSCLRLSEFEEVYTQLRQHIFYESDISLREERITKLRDSLKRILRVKYKILNTVYKRYCFEDYNSLIKGEKHAERVTQLYTASYARFKAGEVFPNLGNLSKEDKLCVYFSTSIMNYKVLSHIKSRSDYQDRLRENIQDLYFPSIFNKWFGDKCKIHYEMEIPLPPKETHSFRALQISQIIDSVKPNYAIFQIDNAYQWELLNETISRLNHDNIIDMDHIIAILTTHPKILDLYTRWETYELIQKINILVMYGGYRSNYDNMCRLWEGNQMIGEGAEIPVQSEIFNPNPSWDIKKRIIKNASDRNTKSSMNVTTID